MSFSLVVARYNEDIEWSKQFENVIIYNKGAELKNGQKEVLLNNVGREGHTYYKHICDNYDNLADYTIFLQGNPFDHSRNIINNMNGFVNSLDKGSDFTYMSDHIIQSNLSGCWCHKGLPLIETYERLFGERKSNMEITFGAGAQFIVSKKRILCRPKSFYAKIVEMLQDEVNPIEGFVIERFHKIIFE